MINNLNLLGVFIGNGQKPVKAEGEGRLLTEKQSQVMKSKIDHCGVPGDLVEKQAAECDQKPVTN